MLVAVLFFVLAKKARKAGFFIAMWCVLYAPSRFLLDFMRKSDLPQRYNDQRYAGLTPAQYVTIAMLGVGIYLLWKKKIAEPPEADDAALTG